MLYRVVKSQTEIVVNLDDFLLIVFLAMYSCVSSVMSVVDLRRQRISICIDFLTCPLETYH